MTKEVFLNKLEEVLEIDQLTETSLIELNSMQTLGIIVFADENFNKQFKTTDLDSIKSVSDLILLIDITFD